MLSDREIQKAKELKKQGYSNADIEAFIGADRIGINSSVHEENTARVTKKDELQKKWFETNAAKAIAAPANFLARDAVGVFGGELARAGVGTDTDKETVQEFVPAATRGQKAGAVLQTAGLAADVGITVASLGAATPMTLARNTAISGGLGYVYDTGEDLVQMEDWVEVIDPDAGTLIGLTAPGIFAGIGAGVRGMRPVQEGAEVVADDVGRAAASVAREVSGEAVEEGAESATTGAAREASGAVQQVQEFGQRIPRAVERSRDALEAAADRRALRQTGTPSIVGAIDNGVDARTVRRVTEAPDTQQEAYRRIVQVASGDDPRNAEIVAGEYATDMYRTVSRKQQEVGAALGEARRALADEPLDFAPNRRTLVSSFKEDGITLKDDGTIEVSRAMDEKEQAALRGVWKELSKYDLDNITPRQIDEIDRFLSRMQYNSTRADNLDAVYINVVDAQTGTPTQVNAFNYIRDAFDEKLLDPAVDTTGQIKKLKTEYSALKRVTGDVESKWFNGLDMRASSDFDLAEAASNALRRPDSRAVSRTTYRQMYNKLDIAARANGYEGPNALDASNFYLKEVEPVFKETTPPASATGIFGGVRQVVIDTLNVGGIDNVDKQKGLRVLLEIDNAAPSSPAPASATREATEQEAAEVDSLLRNIEARQSESSVQSNVEDMRSQSGQGGFFGLFRGDPRRKGLEESLGEVDQIIRRLVNEGVSEESRQIKRLLDARDKIFEQINNLPK